MFVTGTLGDAGLALRELLRGGAPVPAVRARLERPEPRVAAGIALRGLAGAAIDISDGLVADLGHLLEASGVGAEVELGALPLSAAVRDSVERSGDWDLVLGSGDDYELCFTVPPERLGALGSLAGHLGCGIHRIGRVLPGEGLRCVGVDGVLWQPAVRGYDHFSGSVSPDAGP